MWSRAKLKEKAKYTFKLNYWKVVLVSLLVNVIAVGIGSQSVITNNFETIYNESFDDTEDDFPDWYDYEDGYYYDDVYGYEDDFFFDGRNNPDIDAEKIGLVFVSIFLIVIVCFIIVYLIVVAVGMVWAAFIGNPVEVGAKRFFFKSLNEKAEVKEIAFAFDSSYKNVAKICVFGYCIADEQFHILEKEDIDWARKFLKAAAGMDFAIAQNKLRSLNED